MTQSIPFLPFNFQRYLYGKMQTPSSTYENSYSNTPSPYSEKKYPITRFMSDDQSSNPAQKWGMMLAVFGKNTFKNKYSPYTTSATTSSSAVSTPVITTPQNEDVFNLPFYEIDPVTTPVVTKPKKPAKPKAPKKDVTLPIFGGGDLSTPKPTGPFLTPSLNDLFQTLAFKGTVATGQRSGYWGDPHVNDAENGAHTFDVIGPGTYNLLKDKNIALSAEHKKYDNWQIEVTNQINLALGNSNVVFNAYGVPTLNGQALEQGKLMTLPDGSSVNWNGSKLSVTNANYGEYNVEIQLQDWGALNKDGSRIKYLDTLINSTDKGVFSDGILPTGILGEGFDMDNLVRSKLNFGLETYKV